MLLTYSTFPTTFVRDCSSENGYGFQRSGLKIGVENYILCSEIRSRFGEPSGTPPPRIPRSTPPQAYRIITTVTGHFCSDRSAWSQSWKPFLLVCQLQTSLLAFLNKELKMSRSYLLFRGLFQLHQLIPLRAFILNSFQQIVPWQTGKYINDNVLDGSCFQSTCAYTCISFKSQSD